jgi:phosphoglucomutase
MSLCEAAAYYKSKNLSLWEQMLNIYEKYGYFKEDLRSVTLKGIEGTAKIAQIMNDLRSNPPAEFGSYKVLRVRDYKNNEIRDLSTNSIKETGLPNSNVLYFELEDSAWCCARPSGTEPKIKFYMGVKGDSFEDADNRLAGLTQAVLRTVGQ